MSDDGVQQALADALDALLVAFVAVGGVDDLEPVGAIDAALGADEDHRSARERFRQVHEDLRGHPGFFEIEVAANDLVVTAAAVGFRLGRVARCTTRS